nr:unnamed protein product [Digitaria exilis]
MKATSLRNRALIGKSDPYVVLYVRPFFKVRTNVIDDNLNPEWNETFELLVEDKETQSVIFEVYDKNKLQQDKKLGVAKIALNSLEPETVREIALKLLRSLDPLKNEDNTERGTLYLKVMYHPFTMEEKFEALETENKFLTEHWHRWRRGIVGSGLGAYVGLVGSGIGAGGSGLDKARKFKGKIVTHCISACCAGMAATQLLPGRINF